MNQQTEQKVAPVREAGDEKTTTNFTAIPGEGITDAYVRFRQALKDNSYRFSPVPGKTTATRLPGRFLPR